MDDLNASRARNAYAIDHTQVENQINALAEAMAAQQAQTNETHDLIMGALGITHATRKHARETRANTEQILRNTAREGYCGWLVRKAKEIIMRVLKFYWCCLCLIAFPVVALVALWGAAYIFTLICHLGYAPWAETLIRKTSGFAFSKWVTSNDFMLEYWGYEGVFSEHVAEVWAPVSQTLGVVGSGLGAAGRAVSWLSFILPSD